MNSRFVIALVGVMMITLVVALAYVFHRFNTSQERQLDVALTAEAHEEASEIASAGGERLQISARPGPSANDVGPLTKYAVIYDPSGEILDSTATFPDGPPALESLPEDTGIPFDLEVPGERLRAIRVPVPGQRGTTLLLAAPRTDLDGDARLLAGAMAIVYVVVVAWMVVAVSYLVYRFTRLHRRVEQVARRVAEGDLGARVGWSEAGARTRLARDLDETIGRLETLVNAQQRFVASAAHEIRSPLTALYGELSNALRKERDAAEYRQTIERAVELTRELRDLAESLLELARLGGRETQETERVNLAGLAEKVVQASSARSRIDASLEACWVEGRPLELHALVRNLVENAACHSPPGARIAVRTSSKHGMAELTVDDAGEGVAEPERELVFEPFHRGRAARARSSGAGLGLAIARTVARTHGGDVSLEQSPLGGARFRVELPLAS